MFFKKKRVMTDKTTHNNKTNNETADNMSENEQMEEVISNELNTDERGTVDLPESNDDEAEKLKMELAESKDKHIRLIAEFENFKRRNSKERLELIQTAGKDIIQSLLVVLDDVSRAEKQMKTTDDVALIKEGVTLVFNKLQSVLQQKGLKEMEALNLDFDADVHEAITEIPAPTEEMKGKIIDVVEAGYYLNDKLIRHAKVVVGK
jgi:molecular chaperone GrpE